MSTHVVVKGDSLWKIAKIWFGDASRWPEIARLNSLPDGNWIYVGQVLTLPITRNVLHAPDRILSNYSEADGICCVGTESADLFNHRSDQVFTRASNCSRRIVGKTGGEKPQADPEPVKATGSPTLSAVQIIKPVCTINLDGSKDLFAPIVYPAGNATVKLKLTGTASLSTEGFASCELTKDGISLEVESVIKDGMNALIPGYSSSLNINPYDVTEFTASITVTFRPESGGPESKFVCLLTLANPLHYEFEAKPSSITFKVANAELSGQIGLKLEITLKPPQNQFQPDSVLSPKGGPVALQLVAGAGAVVAVVAIVVFGGVPTVIIAAAGAIIKAALAKAASAVVLSKGASAAAMSMGAALLLSEKDGELERKQAVPLTDEKS